MRGYGRAAAMVALLLILLPVAGHAADNKSFDVSVGLGFEFTSGDYGTGTRTNSVFVPFTVAVMPTERWGLSLEIPYVYQSNTNVIAGQFRQMQGQSMAMQSITAAMTGSGMGSGTIRSSSNSNPSAAQSGIGDITFRTGYVLIQEGSAIPQIRPNLFVKIPTADKAKGLGTGEFDEGVAVEISKWFGDWYAFVEPGYTIQGKTSDIPLKNYLNYNVGAGYQVSDKFLPLFILKGSTAPAEGSTALLEARLKLKYQATKHTGIEGYLAKGITTSSPDYGTGLALFYDF